MPNSKEIMQNKIAMIKFRQVLCLLLFYSFGVNAQDNLQVFELGILPTEYAEGMPPDEFQDIEDEILRAIQRIPRYSIVKNQEDYYDAEFGSDIYTQMEVIRKQGMETNVPFLLQIVFGDTEWAATLEEVVISKAVIKDGEVTTPKKVNKYWAQSAKLYVTINLYKVETGELEKSLVFKSSSIDNMKYKSAKAPQKKSFQFAVEKAKIILLKRIKNKIKSIAPLQIKLLEPIEQSDKSISTVSINAGTFHGLKPGEKLYVYYEHEHIIDGKSVIREVDAGSLEIEKTNRTTAICNVKKGGKKMKKFWDKGKALKCNFKNFIGWVDGYGF